MKKFIIIEQVPAIVEYTYEIEAEDKEAAMEMIINGKVDAVEHTVDTIYESSVTLEFTRDIIEEEDI
jgi:hypothetical protein